MGARATYHQPERGAYVALMLFVRGHGVRWERRAPCIVRSDLNPTMLALFSDQHLGKLREWTRVHAIAFTRKKREVS